MRLRQGHVLPRGPRPVAAAVLRSPHPSEPPNLPAALPHPPLPSGSGSHSSGAAPSPTPSCSITLSLRDEAAHVPVTLRASFADRTLAWIAPWGCKRLISAPFLFYPRRFFEVSPSRAASSRLAGAESCIPVGSQGCVLGTEDGGLGLEPARENICAPALNPLLPRRGFH